MKETSLGNEKKYSIKMIGSRNLKIVGLIFVEDVIDELLNFDKLTEIKKMFEYYQFMNFDEFKLRYENYKTIVMSELQ